MVEHKTSFSAKVLAEATEIKQENMQSSWS